MPTPYQTRRPLEPPQSIPTEGRFLFPMCLNIEELITIYECLEKGGNVLGFGRQGPHLEPFWQGLAYIGRVNELECATEGSESGGGVGGGTPSGFYEALCERYPELTEDHMNCIKYQKINGKYYGVIDCGCGDVIYLDLAQASVNPTTGAIAPATDNAPGYIQPVPLTEEQVSGCYSDKAVDIYVNALSTFTDAVFNWSLFGIPAFGTRAAGALMTAIEVQQIAASILNGNIDVDFSNVGYTGDEVKAQFDSVAFRSFLANRLGDDTTVNRFVLNLVATRLSVNNGLNWPTPVSPIFNMWVGAVNMAELNQKLEIAALECESGQSVPAAGGQLGTFYPVEGTSYTVIGVGPLTLPDTTWVAPGFSLSGNQRILGVCALWPEGMPVSAGNNQFFDSRYASGETLMGWFQPTNVKDANGWLPLRYDDTRITPTEATAIADLIGTTNGTEASGAVNVTPATLAVESRVRTGSPSPPAGTSEATEVWYVIGEV